MKLKTILIAFFCISIASTFGVSANQFVPPILVELDSKYLDGSVLDAFNKVSEYGGSKVIQVKDLFSD